MKFSYQYSLTSKKDLDVTVKKLEPYIKQLRRAAEDSEYKTPESALYLPDDSRLLKEVLRVVKEKAAPRLKYVIVIGIGGSNLGAKAVYDALCGFFDILEPERFPKMFFADANDPEWVNRLSRFLESKTAKPDEVIVNVISKSGTTTETIANAALLTVARSRIVVTTDKGSKLHRFAQENKLAALLVPNEVGGRYSVLSPVGLFPLAVVGIDVRVLRKGAEEMRGLCVKSGLENPAVSSAAVILNHYKNGRRISDSFFFHSELESLGKWYRQLMAESLGKDGQGIMPVVSIGSTDLHSVGQLYFGGPNDKITTLINTVSRGVQKQKIGDQFFADLVPEIRGRAPADIMKAIFEAAKSSYIKKKLPFMEAILPDISARSLGAFMQWKMMEIMMLGKLIGVNAFDQPSVEFYKAETRRLLSK